MLDFLLNQTGVTATSGNSPVVITQVILCDSDHTAIGSPIEDFVGNVTNDEIETGDIVDGTNKCNGDFIVIDFQTSMPQTDKTISYIRLAASYNNENTVIAESEPISIVKPGSKLLKLRITGRLFTTDNVSTRENRSSKCTFNCVTIGLPYATKHRQGVVRLADPSMTSSGDTHKDMTVFTAKDTISKIEEYVRSADQYVPWNTDTNDDPIIGTMTAETLYISYDYGDSTANSSTLTADVNGNLVVSSPITGANAVTSTPNYGSTSIAASAITGDTKLTTSTYIANLYSNSIDTAATETAAARKLVTSHAVRAYVEAKDALVVHKAGNETITGVKTFNANIVTGNGALIQGSAVQSQYDDGASPDPEVIWNAAANYSKLPTVEVVSLAIDNVSTDYENADAELQRQIDALNAGQNLADIVASVSDLQNHSTDNLEPGNGSTTVGDKIQVLHDADGNSIVYELRTGAADTSQGSTDIPAQTKHNPDGTTTTCHWAYIGEYGNDAYSKADADDIFFRKDHVATTSTISSHSTAEDYAPSVKAMYAETAKYVKLTSSSSQTIASPLVIKQSTSSTATLSIPDGQHLTANNTLTITADGTHDVVSEYNVTNGTYTVSIDNNNALKLATTSSTADVSGSMVASYRDVTGGTLTDGRLVTVDYMKAHTGSMSDYAKRNDNNTFIAGKTNTFNGSVVLNGSVTGDSVYGTYAANTWNTASTSADLATVSAVNGAIEDKVADLTDDVLIHASDINAVGSIGLFVYSETGNELSYGAEINGQYLKAVGMSLPMSGQISYKSAALVPACSGTWKLLSLAVKRTATEPCLVMAQKIHDTYPRPQS